MWKGTINEILSSNISSVLLRRIGYQTYYKVNFSCLMNILGSRVLYMHIQRNSWSMENKMSKFMLKRKNEFIREQRRSSGKEILQDCRDPTTVTLPHSTKSSLPSKIPKLYCNITFCNFSHIKPNLVFSVRISIRHLIVTIK